MTRPLVAIVSLTALLVPSFSSAGSQGPTTMVWFGVRGIHEDQEVVRDAAKLVEMAADVRKVTMFSDEDVRREMDKTEAWKNAVNDAMRLLKEARDRYVDLDLEAAMTRVEQAEKLLGNACGEVLYRKAVYDALSLHGLLLWQKGDKLRAVERFRQAVVIAPEERPLAGLFTPDVELGMEEARIAMLGSQKPAATYDQLCDCAWKFGSPFLLFGHVVSSSKGRLITLMLFGAERGDLLASRNAALEGNVEDIKQGITAAAMALFNAAEEAHGTKGYMGRARPVSAGQSLDLSKIFPTLSKNPWAYALVGTAAAFTGVGITFSVLTMQAESDYEKLISPDRNAMPDLKALDQVKSAGDMRALAATISYSLAGVAAAAAIYLFIWPPGGSDKSAANDAPSKSPTMTPTIVPLPGGAALNYGLSW